MGNGHDGRSGRLGTAGGGRSSLGVSSPARLCLVADHITDRAQRWPEGSHDHRVSPGSGPPPTVSTPRRREKGPAARDQTINLPQFANADKSKPALHWNGDDHLRRGTRSSSPRTGPDAQKRFGARGIGLSRYARAGPATSRIHERRKPCPPSPFLQVRLLRKDRKLMGPEQKIHFRGAGLRVRRHPRLEVDWMVGKKKE